MSQLDSFGSASERILERSALSAIFDEAGLRHQPSASAPRRGSNPERRATGWSPRTMLVCVLALGAMLVGMAALAGDGGTTAEQIRAESLCRQAVTIAAERGDDEAGRIYCGFASTDPVGYWTCIADRVRSGAPLIRARQDC